MIAPLPPVSTHLEPIKRRARCSLIKQPRAQLADDVLSKLLTLTLILPFLATGCATPPAAGPGGQGAGSAPQAPDLTPVGPISASRFEAGRLVAIEGPVALAGARNETLGFAVRLQRAGLDPASSLRLTDLTRIGTAGPALASSAAEIGQILPLPVDFNRAGFVRQSGTATAARDVPRAIVPLPGSPIAFASLRPESDGATLLWIDLAVPTDTAPGDYAGSVEVTASNRTVARLPIMLTVFDLVLPDSRSLNVAGRVTWESLTKQFPDSFEAITPKLINRREERYKKPVAVLDGMVKLAQRHRVALTVDRLQPSVKWNPFSVNWDDFNSLVGPWLDGTAFADREPLGFWPLPTVDFLGNYPAAARRQYWENAAAYFDSREWLARAPVWIEANGAADSGPARQRLMEQAATVLAAHPRVRVALPLEGEQLQFADGGVASLPPRGDAKRLVTASPGIVFNTPIQTAGPRDVDVSQTFLRTDLAGLIPYAGIGGDERDVRVWAWLAYTRGASILRFDDALPAATDPKSVAEPGELVWFYPGKWFGVDGIVPSLQLKWLRRAEQDHEYLALANARGMRIDAFLMARLITKPVQIRPAQHADAAYALMTGTADANVWDAGMRILAKLILLRAPGAQQVDEAARTMVNIELLQWAQPQEKPLLLGRTTLFSPEADGSVGVRIGVDVYNPSDTTPRGNKLGFSGVPRGWTIDPAPAAVPQLETYHVDRFALSAKVDPNAVDVRQRGRAMVELTDGYTGRPTPAPLTVPVTVSRRREGGLALDGLLGDWSDDDAITLSPLTRMIDRPTLQQHAVADASTGAAVYSGWSEGNVYVAFKVAGLTGAAPAAAQNFVRYDFRRAWYEDVIELIVQPIYPDGTPGPALHVAAKPNGGIWSERKLDLTEGRDDAWEPLDAGVRFASNVEGDAWRGEVAIPWSALGPANAVGGPARMPALLRFNFIQHQHATGASASWAGPIDFGRDDLFTGALVLRSADPR